DSDNIEYLDFQYPTVVFTLRDWFNPTSPNAILNLLSDQTRPGPSVRTPLNAKNPSSFDEGIVLRRVRDWLHRSHLLQRPQPSLLGGGFTQNEAIRYAHSFFHFLLFVDQAESLGGEK